MVSIVYGFVGLGNMGQPMARNAVEKGLPMVVHDIAGTADRAPKGAEVAESNVEVALRADVTALSLPTVEVNRAVILEFAGSGKSGSVVVDTCTIGPEAAAENARILGEAGIEYVDSPVSGLKFRAEEGALASMAAGSDKALMRARPLIEGYSRVVYHVGSEAGQGQRMKVVNNALCISSYVTTSEALAYGENGGLDIDTMLEVVNASSGQNFATLQIFPKYVAAGKYDSSGAEAHIVKKDIGLFVKGSNEEDTPNDAIARAYQVITEFAEADPQQDQMRIYSFVKDRNK
ncbi:MAG: NADPH nitroreductase [Rhodospirillaceae bacterium]|nr:NADPH nitroreductase [Rhodospirillaceae bacterium]